MDPCTKSANTDNLVEPSILSQLSGSISDTHQGQMNVSICESYTNGLESETTKKQEIDQKHDGVWTNEAVPLTTKKIKYDYLKISWQGLIASSYLFLLDSYQDWLDLDSNLTMMRAIIGIPRKHASWWTISWENNFLMTKIPNETFCTEVIKFDTKWQNIYLTPVKIFTKCILKLYKDKDWKGVWWNCHLKMNMILEKNSCQLWKQRIQNTVKTSNRV